MTRQGAKPYPGTNAEIERIAEKLRAQIVAIQDDPDNVSSGAILREIVKRTGGNIEVVEDPSEQEAEGGSLVIHRDRDYTIFLSPFTTPLRDNFTIAHELGHYVLHYFRASPRPLLPLGFTRYGTGRIEWQANRFAAALLMPTDSFCAAFRRFDGDLHLLSGHFDVSLPAVEVRARSLNLL